MPRFHILAEEVILRDEHDYLASGARFLTFPRKNLTMYLSASAFEMLVALTKAMEPEEAWIYYLSRCRENGDVSDREEFESFCSRLVDAGVIEETERGGLHQRPLSNLSLTPNGTSRLSPMTFPSRVSLVLTMRCNLACKHCLRESSPLLRGEGELTTDELLSLMDELDANGVTSLQLSGGEVTVRKDIEVLTRHVKNLRCHVQYLTNGFVLRPGLVEVLKEVQQEKEQGFFVHLSLDGGTAETNDWLRGKSSFSRTLRAAECLRSAGVTVVVETCLTPSNIGELELIAKLCAERGVSQLTFHPISYTGRAGCNPLFLPLPVVREASRRAGVLAEKYQGTMKVDFGYQFVPHGRDHDDGSPKLPPNATGAGMFHMAVAADGGVYPCIESVGAPSLVMGDVRTDHVSDIWRSERWDIFRGGWTLDELEGCRGCVFDRRCATQSCRCYAVASGMGFYSPFKDCYANSEILWEGTET